MLDSDHPAQASDNVSQPILGGPADPGQNFLQQALRMSKHPVALVFHFVFKTLAVVLYLIGGAFNDFVTIFVIIVILQAVDFWTVKNVSGRLLVGLRWWNEITDDGHSEWRFESLEDRSQIPVIDSRAFWLGLYLPVLFWVPACFSTFFSLAWHWLLCDVVAATLAAANIMGYMKASKSAKQQITAFGTQVATNLITRSMLGSAQAP